MQLESGPDVSRTLLNFPGNTSTGFTLFANSQREARAPLRKWGFVVTLLAAVPPLFVGLCQVGMSTHSTSQGLLSNMYCL